MGVDLGTRKLATAVISDNGDIDTDSWISPDRFDRPWQLEDLSSYLVRAAEEHEVDALWIEAIIMGNNRKYSLLLAQTFGACLSALVPLLDRGLVFGTADNKAWKKEIVGNGNASKDMIRSWLESSHPIYAEACLGDQDRMDAVCVALYGKAIMGRADGLSLEDDR